MFLVLVVRNIIRNLGRLAPMMLIIIAVFAAMVTGNAVLAATGNNLYRTYGRMIAGDVSVSAAAASNFTLFGSDQLLVGEYLIAGTVPEVDRLRTVAAASGQIRATAGVVSAAARIQTAGASAGRTIFGVDFAEYAALFPELELVAGEYPRRGEPGIVLQAGWPLGADAAPDRFTALLGTPALLASGTGRTFTLREVPITGFFRYPVDDSVLATVALVDADTARALNGYQYGALDAAEIPEADQATLTMAVDDLFGGGEGTPGGAAAPASEAGPGGIDINALLGSAPSGEGASAEYARDTIAGTWNFFLIGLNDPRDRSRVVRLLESRGFTSEAGFRVRPWWETVGGNASLVRYLQIMFNAGLVFVAVGAAIIATNALMLSVLERTGEIGTLRALGASRARVALMIAVETILIVFGAALVGIAAGAVATGALNRAGYIVENRYIRILFAGDPVAGEVTGTLVWNHLIAGVVLAAVAVVYPLRRVLQVSPREAMAA